ncbi:hypothetical protein [Mycolicibacterium sp.]|uniref:hypothetical protein n=1 Tax=Mycolicibacterium sp. TaxID=2320850 RepID=UPI003D13F785
MAAPPEPVIVAEYGGLVIAERGPEILVIDRGHGPAEITAFVLLIITVVFGMFGLVSVSSALAGAMAAQTSALGAGILAIGVVTGVALVLLVKKIRARRRRSLTSFTPVAVFDRARRIYRDGSGHILAPLDQVRFETRMQLASSSPMIVAVTPHDARILKRGNPFTGGIGTMEQVLTAVVHGARR